MQMKTLGRRRFWSDGSLWAEEQPYNDVCFFTLEFKSPKRNEMKWNESKWLSCVYVHALSADVERKKREYRDKKQRTHRTITITTSTYPFPFHLIPFPCMHSVVCKWAGCLFIDLSLILLYCSIYSSGVFCRYAMHIHNTAHIESKWRISCILWWMKFNSKMVLKFSTLFISGFLFSSVLCIEKRARFSFVYVSISVFVMRWAIAKESIWADCL